MKVLSKMKPKLKERRLGPLFHCPWQERYQASRSQDSSVRPQRVTIRHKLLVCVPDVVCKLLSERRGPFQHGKPLFPVNFGPKAKLVPRPGALLCHEKDIHEGRWQMKIGKKRTQWAVSLGTESH